MDLWIRSQHKEMFFKVNSSLIVRSNNGDGKCYFIECDGRKIAMYKTRERALEVLNEIENLILFCFTERRLDYQDCDLWLKSKILENMVEIYEMPKE